MLLILSALAASVQPAEAPSWVWLNIPGATGPGARFSYHSAVRRDGPRVQVRLRHDAAIPERSGTVTVDSLVELDCLAVTWRSLAETRGRTRRATPRAASAPLVRGTRPYILAYLLCPNGAGLRP